MVVDGLFKYNVPVYLLLVGIELCGNVVYWLESRSEALGSVNAGGDDRGDVKYDIDIFAKGYFRDVIRIRMAEFIPTLVELLEELLDYLGLEDVLRVIFSVRDAVGERRAKVEVAADDRLFPSVDEGSTVGREPSVGQSKDRSLVASVSSPSSSYVPSATDRPLSHFVVGLYPI